MAPDTVRRSMTVSNIATIGLIGAGNIGSALGRLAVQHGYRAVLSNSRGPETLTELARDIGGGAEAGTVEQAAEQGDVVVVSIPLKAIGDVPAEPLAGKIVLDTNNYYPHRDGHIAELDDESTTTSELLARRLPGAKVVKAFNHIGAADLESQGAPAGTPNRRALAIFGDDDGAKQTARALLDEFGFDVVDGGPLAESWRIQRDTPGYVQPDNADELRQHLAEAIRPPAA
jgi:predicted dinucleotide-binding enzyme